MADRLPALCQAAGVNAVESYQQDERIDRGDPEFAQRAALWSEVIESLSGQLAVAGFCTESDLQQAQECYGSWVETDLISPTLSMRAVSGVVAG